MNFLSLFATCLRPARRLEVLLDRRRPCEGIGESETAGRMCGKQGRSKQMQGAGGKEHQRKKVKGHCQPFIREKVLLQGLYCTPALCSC